MILDIDSKFSNQIFNQNLYPLMFYQLTFELSLKKFKNFYKKANYYQLNLNKLVDIETLDGRHQFHYHSTLAQSSNHISRLKRVAIRAFFRTYHNRTHN